MAAKKQPESSQERILTSRKVSQQNGPNRGSGMSESDDLEVYLDQLGGYYESSRQWRFTEAKKQRVKALVLTRGKVRL